MLGLCENNAGNRASAIAELETALRIDPTLLLAHELIQEVLEADGQADRAAAHRIAIEAIRAAGNKLPN